MSGARSRALPSPPCSSPHTADHHPLTFSASSSIGLVRSATSTWRLSANEVALLTRPSISAPLKFLQRAAWRRGWMEGKRRRGERSGQSRRGIGPSLKAEQTGGDACTDAAQLANVPTHQLRQIHIRPQERVLRHLAGVDLWVGALIGGSGRRGGDSDGDTSSDRHAATKESQPRVCAASHSPQYRLPRTCRICTRPRSSGSPISTCTSSRPGRSSASSSMSRLVGWWKGVGAVGWRGGGRG